MPRVGRALGHVFLRNAVVGHLQAVDSARLLQFHKRLDERHRALGLRQMPRHHAHGLGHSREPFGGLVGEERIVRLGKHDQPRAVRQFRIEGAQGVLHAVFGRAAGGRLDHAGKRACQRHLRAGFQIRSVLHGGGQIFGEEFNAFQRIGVAERRGDVRDIPFRGVEQRVKALIGGQVRRDGQHHFRVHHGEHGEGFRAAEADLLVGVLFGDDGPRVGFRARARRGRNRHDGQGAVHQRLPLAGAAGDVIPVVAGVFGHDRNAFRGVDGAAAAKADHEVAALLAGQRRAFMDMAEHRVGQDLVEQRVPDALLVQHVDEAIEIAVRAHGFSGGDDDERFLARQGRCGEIVEAAGAEQDLGGNGIREFHMILPDEWTVRKRTVNEV